MPVLVSAQVAFMRVSSCISFLRADCATGAVTREKVVVIIMNQSLGKFVVRVHITVDCQ